MWETGRSWHATVRHGSDRRQVLDVLQGGSEGGMQLPGLLVANDYKLLRLETVVI